jgi:hypothetical protein
MATSTNGTAHAPWQPQPARRWPPANTAARDRTISRLAVLKAAAEFGASRPDLKSGDVLKIANSWLAWVEKPQAKERD